MIGMDDADRDFLEKAKRDVAPFAVAVARVLDGPRDTREHADGVCEIQTMLGPVGLALCFGPRKPDIHIVYTLRVYVKSAIDARTSGRCASLTRDTSRS